MVQVHPAFVCFCLRMKELHSHTVGTCDYVRAWVAQGSYLCGRENRAPASRVRVYAATSCSTDAERVRAAWLPTRAISTTAHEERAQVHAP